MHLQQKLRDDDLRLLFSLKASSFQEVIQNLAKEHAHEKVHLQLDPELDNFLLKASILSDKLQLTFEPLPLFQITGNEALSASDSVVLTPDDIPVPLVFGRIKGALQAPNLEQEPTVEMVEAALDRLEVAAHQDHDGCVDLGLHTPLGGASSTPALDMAAATGAGAAPQPPPLEVQPPVVALDAFFASPPRAAAALVEPQVDQKVKARPRRTYSMANVRRSARLAKRPALPAVQQAQLNLCRKLGLATDEQATVEQILAEYVAMYNGPLPSHMVAALSSLLGLDDDLTGQVDDAMIQLVGEGVEELREGEDPAVL